MDRHTPSLSKRRSVVLGVALALLLALGCLSASARQAPAPPTGVGVTAKPAQPTITSLSPSSGDVGASVTITGSGFAATQGSGTVTFNGVTATASVWSALSITVTVPAGATSGNVVVSQNGLTSAGSSFVVGTVDNSCDITASGADTASASALNTWLSANDQTGTAGNPWTMCVPSLTLNMTSVISFSPLPYVFVRGAGSLSTTGGGDATILQDNCTACSELIQINIPATGVFRWAGITIRSGTASSSKDGGTFGITGPGSFRLDHSRWLMTSAANYRAVDLYSAAFGVVDHVIMDLTGTNAFYIQNSRAGTGDTPHAMGNYEWSLPTGFGTANAVYIEDSQINGDASSHACRIWDLFTAGRAVIRFSTLRGCTMGENHATGHSPDDRGGRLQEAYGNTAVMTSGQTEPNFVALDIAGGGAIAWNNSSTNGFKSIWNFNITRKNNNTYGQTSPPNGWGYCGSAFGGSTSIWDQNSPASTGYACLDQPGRGPGDILSGVVPSKTNLALGTPGWPRQVLEPIYFFENTVAPVSGWGGVLYRNDTDGRLIADRDWYQQASGAQTTSSSPFNGTTGTGWGLISRRPSSCTPGVGYMSTDEGTFNQSTSNPEGVQMNGADRKFYVCVASAWVARYGGGADNTSGEPYTYPHPFNVN